MTLRCEANNFPIIPQINMVQVPSTSANDSLPALMRRLWRQLGPRRQKQFSLQLVLMVLASFADVLTIGIVLPFIMALASPEKIMQAPLARPVLDTLGIHQAVELVTFVTILFCTVALLSGVLRAWLLKANTRLSCDTGADISIGIYQRTLYQPYLTHVSRNTAEVVAGVTIKTNHVIANVFGPALTLASSTIMLVAVVGTLLLVDPIVAISAFGSFGLLYVLVGLFTRKRAAADSDRISVELNSAIKSLNEGLGGIRDVLIEGAQPTYCEEYHQSDLRMRRAQASLLFVSQFPRYMVESLGMILIAVIALSLSFREGGLVGAIPVLGALALGAQRLLPVIQQAYAAWSSIVGGRAQLRDTVALLEQPLPAPALPTSALPPFARDIVLTGISFRYAPQAPWILRDIDLRIAKGERIGIIGSTGSGKSTLLDLFMGLLPVEEGRMEIDGTQLTSANLPSWQAQLAHVPQAIFLTDRSIAENIAFGQPRDKIDMERVRKAASHAQLGELIDTWSAGYDTMVGERGVRLSGGQRQRIGIARALYKNAQIIVFDEATSALDNETEEAVMKSIESLSKSLTILVIAHRLSTLRMCDRIVELDSQGIRRIGTWDEIIAPT